MSFGLKFKAVVCAVVVCVMMLETGAWADATRSTINFWGQALRDAKAATGGGGFGTDSPALMYLSIFEATNAVTGNGYHTYSGTSLSNGARADLAAAYASHAALIDLFPTQTAVLDAALVTSTAGATTSEKTAAQNVGQQAYAAVKTQRSSAPSPLSPFIIANPAAHLPAPPPDPAGTAYADAYNFVKSKGAKTGSTRTPGETDIANFWSDQADLISTFTIAAEDAATHAGQQGVDYSRTMALFAAGMHDTLSAAFMAKQVYNTPRPITAIRDGDTDTNPLTVGDLTWESLGTNVVDGDLFSYPSGGGSFGGYFAEILADLLGSDDTSLQIASLSSGNRAYTKLSDVGDELAMSRVYNGEHFLFDVQAGQGLGASVASDVASHGLQVIPGPSAFGLILMGLLFRRRRPAAQPA